MSHRVRQRAHKARSRPRRVTPSRRSPPGLRCVPGPFELPPPAVTNRRRRRMPRSTLGYSATAANNARSAELTGPMVSVCDEGGRTNGNWTGPAHTDSWQRTKPTGAVDIERIERAVREILISIGENPDRDGLRDTPTRVARAYAEILGGYRDDPTRHLERQFEVDHNEMVIVRDIPFASLCEHHMLPFIGRAHVAYIPGKGGRVCGLSKLARLVDGFARRLQVQERLNMQVADALVSRLEASGRWSSWRPSISACR